jgi:hypothetical protein
MAVPYPGNIPTNVNKDAKYSIVSGSDGYQVRLIVTLSAGVRELLTTDEHPELVEMVNEIKHQYNGAYGGAFYINEFLDVLVPTVDRECYFAGTYQKRLTFDLEGQIISPKAPESLRPGEEWSGPHVGVRYKLKAGGRDISYEKVTGTRQTEHRLSDVRGADDAARLARRLAQHKGDAGGRVYINEASEFFSPPAQPGDPYIYLGNLDEDYWFEPPDVPRP